MSILASLPTFKTPKKTAEKTIDKKFLSYQYKTQRETNWCNDAANLTVKEEWGTKKLKTIQYIMVSSGNEANKYIITNHLLMKGKQTKRKMFKFALM